MNIHQALIEQARDYPQKPAIIFKDEKINFCQLKDNSFKVANYLRSLGIESNKKVAIFLPNTLEAVYSYLGVLILGAVLVPFDFMLTEEELIHLINHAEAEILITQIKKGIDLKNVKKSCPNLKEIILCKEKIDGFCLWQDILKKSSPKEPPSFYEPAQTACILYTSGSTGHPKGVELTFNHLNIPLKTVDYFLKLSSSDTLLCGGVPFSHLGGLDYILVVVARASTLILMERFKPYQFLLNAQEYKVTAFWIVPSMYTAILSLKEYEKFNLPHLRYAVVFGAPSSPHLLKKFHRIAPNAFLLNGWGMTETSAPNCVLPPGIDKIESIGKFFNMEAKIVDEEGRILGANEKGELWVKGEGVMKGYFKEPLLTQEVLTCDGWLKTGDIAYYDSQGLFYIVGRKKDMIKVGGEVVFSSEVEEKISLHPEVKEVAVIGVPDRLRGEAPKAFVVLKKNEKLPQAELKEFLKKHLAHFKIPHYIEFRKNLPKTRTGKIDKKRLKDEENSSYTRNYL